MTRTYDAPAKINLWLRVFARDSSGYHPLDTLFCAIDWCDRLHITPAPELQLEVTGADVGPIEQNLAWRAAQEYYRALGMSPRSALRLDKHIPAGAGLGGGSSDAATVLRALQELHEAALPQPEVMALAARLGSDVPFFLCGSAWAHASGRGEVLQTMPPLPSRYVLVVLPEFAVATSDAYAWLDQRAALPAAEASWAAPRSWQDVEKRASNTFESVLFERFPELARVRDLLQRAGAAIALLSGSGSALFGIFADPQTAAAAQQSLSREPHLRLHLARTLEMRTD